MKLMNKTSSFSNMSFVRSFVKMNKIEAGRKMVNIKGITVEIGDD